MSKRQAGLQITKDREDEEEDWGRDGPPDPVEQATAEVLATRKIALPRTRRKPINEAEEGRSASPNPFSFGVAAPATQKSDTTEASSFASMAKTKDNSASPNPFSSISSSTVPAMPAFSFGAASQSPVTTPAEAKPLERTSAFSNTFAKPQQSTAKAASEDGDLNDPEFDSLVKQRSLNKCFESAIRASLENDDFADLTKICHEYRDHYSSVKAVPIIPAKNVNGTNIYPSFSATTSNTGEGENRAPGVTEKSKGVEGPEATVPAPAAKDAEPVFKFSASAPSFSFGEAKDTTSGSTFKFGSNVPKPVEPPTSSTPTFNFGTSSTSAKLPEESEQDNVTSTPAKDSVPKSNDFSWTPDRGIKFGDSSKTSEAKGNSPSFGFHNPMASPSQPSGLEKTSPKPLASGFSFGSQSTTGFSFGQAAPLQADKGPANTNLPSNPPTFTFGSSAPTFSFGQSTAPSFSFQAPKKDEVSTESTTKAPAQEPKEDQADEDAMPEEPRTNDALVAGPGAGEEDEEELYAIPRAKLFKFNADNSASPWSDLGICAIRVLVHKESKKSRIIARAEGAGALRLNARMYPHFKYTKEGKASVKVYELVSAAKTNTYLIKIKEPATAEKLVKVLNDNKQ